MKKRKFAVLVLTIALALCAVLAVAVLPASAETVPVPASKWSFATGDDVSWDESGNSRTMNAFTVKDGAIEPGAFIEDSRFGQVLAADSFANNKWGDQTCPWYLDLNSQQTTLSMWVNIPAAEISGDGSAVACVLFSDLITGFEGDSTNLSWTLWMMNDGSLSFSTFDFETDVWGGGWNLGSVTADTWQQVTIVFDKPFNKLTAYVDAVVHGPSIGDGNGVSVYLPADMNLMKPVTERDQVDGAVKYRGFQIGQDGARGRDMFAGKFADVRYYQTALTAAQVKAAYEAELAGDALTLKAGYDFTNRDYLDNQDNSLTLINDLSGNKGYMISNYDTVWEDDTAYTKVRADKSFSYNLENPVRLKDGFTISMSVKAKELTPFTFLMTDLMPFVNPDTQENSFKKTFDIHVNGEGRVAFEVNDGAAGWFSITGPDSADTLAVGEWVNLAVTYDKSTRTIMGFVNGKLTNFEANYNIDVLPEPDENAGLSIGVNSAQLVGLTGYSQAFNGKIANVRIYEHAIGVPAIAKLVAGDDGSAYEEIALETADALPSDKLVGAYNMDEGMGEVLHDLSPTHRNFVLGAGTNWVQDFTNGSKYDYVVAPGFAVSNNNFDLSEHFSVTTMLNISAAHNGFGVVMSGKSESRPHDLGYLGKDFYIESNPAIWNIQINSIGRLCFEDQGAWDLNLIEVPYQIVPPGPVDEQWMAFAMTVEKEADDHFVFRFYFNGVLVHVAYKTVGVGAPELGDQTVVLSNQTASNNLQGYLAEIRMYDKTMTAGEVRRQMAGDGLETPEDVNEGALVKLKEFAPKSEYRVGEELSITLSEYFDNRSGETLVYSAKSDASATVGTINNGVFKLTLTEPVEKLKITISAAAGLQTVNLEFNVKVVKETGGGDTTTDPDDEGCGGCKSGGSAAAVLLVLGALAVGRKFM